jgi:hypothetical protein
VSCGKLRAVVMPDRMGVDLLRHHPCQNMTQKFTCQNVFLPPVPPIPGSMSPPSLVRANSVPCSRYPLRRSSTIAD